MNGSQSKLIIENRKLYFDDFPFPTNPSDCPASLSTPSVVPRTVRKGVFEKKDGHHKTMPRSFGGKTE